MAKQYFLRRGKKVIGPMAVAALKRQVSNEKIIASDQLSETKNGPWKRVDTVPALRDLISPADDEWSTDDIYDDFDFRDLWNTREEEKKESDDDGIFEAWRRGAFEAQVYQDSESSALGPIAVGLSLVAGVVFVLLKLGGDTTDMLGFDLTLKGVFVGIAILGMAMLSIAFSWFGIGMVVLDKLDDEDDSAGGCLAVLMFGGGFLFIIGLCGGAIF